MFLPGEVSKVTCSYMEKSAEFIVLAGNEPFEKMEGSRARKDRTLNHVWIRIGIGLSDSLYLEGQEQYK